MPTQKKKIRSPRKKNDPVALKQFSRRMNEAMDDMGIPVMGDGRATQAARLFDVSQRAVRRWLGADGFPSQSEYQSIADKLSVRVEWLFFGLGPKNDKLIKSGTNKEQLKLKIDSLLEQGIAKNNIRISSKARHTLSEYLSRHISKLQTRK